MFKDLKEIEELARKKFGEIEPKDCFIHFIKEIGELFTAPYLSDFPKELFDVLALGYSFFVNHKYYTHEDFVKFFKEKIKEVKEILKEE